MSLIGSLMVLDARMLSYKISARKPSNGVPENDQGPGTRVVHSATILERSLTERDSESAPAGVFAMDSDWWRRLLLNAALLSWKRLGMAWETLGTLPWLLREGDIGLRNCTEIVRETDGTTGTTPKRRRGRQKQGFTCRSF